jgi:hypothetical protein
MLITPPKLEFLNLDPDLKYVDLLACSGVSQSQPTHYSTKKGCAGKEMINYTPEVT